MLREQDFAQDLTCIKVDEWRAVDTLNAEPELGTATSSMGPSCTSRIQGWDRLTSPISSGP